MSNHFWNIGFQLKSSSEYRDLALLALERGEIVERKGEFQYECWVLGSAELWLKTIAGSEIAARRIMDLSPHYDGKTRTELYLQRRVIRGNDGPLDAAYVAMLNSDGCPLVFDVPVLQVEPIVPCPAKVQITAFAQDNMKVYANEQTYDEYNADKKGWASKALVPCGMFNPKGEKFEPPDSQAIIAGIVTETASFVNPHTGHSFQWAVISSYLVDYDLVVGPDICEQPLAVDNVIVGTFWLSAKLLSFDNLDQG